jgi:DNA-binding transcriptional LysR family regulator
MRNRLPLNALQALDRAARAGSFAAVAQELGVSPTAISQHIRLLEDRCGKQVFLRRANGVELTDAGRELFLRVAGAFSGLTEAAAHLKTSASRPQAALSVIASVGELWLLSRLADLADRAGVRIIEENRNPIDFAGRGADIRITYGAAACPGHMVEVLFRDRMGTVAAPLLAAGLRGALGADGGGLIHTWRVPDLCQSAVLGRLAPGFGQPAPPRFRQGFSVGRLGDAATAARPGVGVALLPETLAAAGLARGSLVAAAPMPHPYVMIARRAARHCPGAEQVWYHLAAPGRPPQSAAFK